MMNLVKVRVVENAQSLSSMNCFFLTATPMFSVQSSYKLNLPQHLIFHCSSIKLVETIGQGIVNPSCNRVHL